jgi:integrase
LALFEVRPHLPPPSSHHEQFRVARPSTGTALPSLQQTADRRLGDKAVALVVKRSIAAAGLDPSRYSGHSLRAGLATQAAASGVSDHAIMRQTGHRDRKTLDKYVREGRLFRDNAAAAVGL